MEHHHSHTVSTTSIDDAKRAAKRLLQRYDRSNRGHLTQQDIAQILADIYADAKLHYAVNPTDQASYFKLLDCNRDNIVTLEDLEQVCIKYLCTSQRDEHVVTEHKSHASNVRRVYAGDQGYKTSGTYQTGTYQHGGTTSYQHGGSHQTGGTYKTYQSPSHQQYSQQPSYTTGQQSYTTNYKQPTTSYQTNYSNQHQQGEGMYRRNEQMSGSYLKHEVEQKQTQLTHKNKKVNLPQGNVKFNSANIFGNKTKCCSDHAQEEMRQRFRLRDPHEVKYKTGPLLEQIKANYARSRQRYSDPDFPANARSLSRDGYWYDGEPIPARDWVRPEQHFQKSYELFQDGIMPGDIKQGQLGDCYFQCSLAALAEWPHRVQRLFSDPKRQECGAYSVWVVFNGVQQEVVVDDNLWYDNQYREFVSMQSNGEEIWPQILEKAWAKLNKDYKSIDGGFARDALHDLTGAPVIHYRIAEERNYNQVKHLLLKELIDGEKEDFIMCGATYGEDPDGYAVGDSESKDGIFYSHAYSILAAYEITTTRGQKINLCKIRNPHGEGEFTGRYSDRDTRSWSEISPSDKKKIGFVDEDDGVFFIQFEELRKYFEDVQICQYRDFYEYNGLRVMTQQGEQEHYFKVVVPQPCDGKQGYYYFQVTQKARAEYGEDSNYQYTRAAIHVVSEQGQYISAAQGRQKNICSYYSQQDPQTLPPGTYYVMAKVKFDSHQSQENIHSFGVGVYGKEVVDIQEISQSQVPSQVAGKLRQPPSNVLEVLPSFII